MSETRLPWQNKHAEAGLIAVLLRDQVMVADVVQRLSPDDFRAEAHRVIFRAIVELDADGKTVDVVTVAERILAAGKMAEIGGEDYLAELLADPPSGAALHQYIEIIKARATDRRIDQAAAELMKLAADPVMPAVEKMSMAESIVSTIAVGADINETPRVDVAVQEVYRALDERRARRDTRFSGLPTGFAELDNLTAGLRRSELTVLAARPSVGKTALAANIAVHVAVHERTPVLFVSLEQKRTELVERILAGMARVDLKRISSGRLREAEAERVMKAGETLSRSPLYVDDNESQSVVQIAANVRRMKRRHGIGFVVIDYLQLAQPDGRKNSREEQVAGMSRRLKLLARELDIPVLCLAQLNREVENRQSGKPKLSDLRESGAIEQDADNVLLLHRHDDALIDVLVAKQRNGPTGEAKLVYVKQHVRFENYTTGGH